MQVVDPELFRLVEKVGEHYKTNINNRILRRAFLNMDLKNATWDQIERFIELGDYERTKGFSFHELYEQVHAMALFVNYARHKLLPNIRAIVSEDEGARPGGAASKNDRVLRDMAINNFRSNLGILADSVNELYLKTIELDKKLNGESDPVYLHLAELKQLGQLLT